MLSLQVQVPQTAAQYQAFRDFYFTDLNAGEDWFLMPLLVGVDTQILVCHIQDGFKQERNQTVHAQYLLTFAMEAFRGVSTPYVPIELDLIDPTGPDNPDLGTFDIIDPTGPDNPSLGTFDIIYGGEQIGFPPI